MAREQRNVTRSDAMELFGEQRHSTPEEQAAMRAVYDKWSVPLEPGMSIFDLELPDAVDDGSGDDGSAPPAGDNVV